MGMGFKFSQRNDTESVLIGGCEIQLYRNLFDNDFSSVVPRTYWTRSTKSQLRVEQMLLE